MADFGEICPLFSTGVFGEVTFPNILGTDISNSGNALMGTLLSVSHRGAFSFGRTVVVTGAFVRRNTTAKGQMSPILKRHTSILAAGTAFATCTITEVALTFETATWIAMTVPTPQTFTSTDILGFSFICGTNASGGIYDLIVRYKDK